MFPFDVGDIVFREPGKTAIESIIALLQQIYDLFLFLVNLII